MTLQTKEVKWGFRNLARLNAIVRGLQLLCFAPFLYTDSSSTIVDADLL